MQTQKVNTRNRDEAPEVRQRTSANDIDSDPPIPGKSAQEPPEREAQRLYVMRPSAEPCQGAVEIKKKRDEFCRSDLLRHFLPVFEEVGRSTLAARNSFPPPNLRRHAARTGRWVPRSLQEYS